jgi:hypothetical protein
MMDLGGKLFDGKQVWAKTDGVEFWYVWPKTIIEVEGSRRTLTSEEYDTYFGITALARAKAAALVEIDQLTGDRIGAGVPLPAPWEGVRLSASLNAQFNWWNRYERRAMLTFPIPYPAADNSSIIQVKSVEEVELVYLTGDSWVQGYLRASTEAKAKILDCSTREEVESVMNEFRVLK